MKDDLHLEDLTYGGQSKAMVSMFMTYMTAIQLDFFEHLTNNSSVLKPSISGLTLLAFFTHHMLFLYSC